MFGGHNDEKSEKDNENATDAQPAENAPVINANAVPPAQPAADEPADDAPAVSDDPNWQHPGTPIDDTAKINDVISPAGGFPRSTSHQVSTDGAATPDDLADPAIHDLIEVRQKALGELSPLLDQLDLSPEEKFRTVMMVIQASDDQTLVKEAYDAAHGITDEKTKAQALLDIVNEINYFTQPPVEN